MLTSPPPEEATSHAGATRYVVCWLALALLTALTFGLSQLTLGPWSLAIALAIAGTKGTIVALFFMHLSEQRGASRLVLMTSVLFVAVLSTLVVADELTRFSLVHR